MGMGKITLNMEVSMKKIAFIGIVIFLVLFMVTCEEWFPGDNDIVGYTDVVYSKDGTMVTVYLDGAKVPVTKAQRAMTTNLAKMAYDYIEVIFDTGVTGGLARASWELGQSAGISGVTRGINYLTTGAGHTPAGTAAPKALMFAGKKDGKTLLAVGNIRDVDHKAAAGAPELSATGGWLTTITSDTECVTFYLDAIKTGLKASNDDDIAYGYDAKVTLASFESSDTTLDDLFKEAKRSSLGNLYYPLYPLPNPEAIAGPDFQDYPASYKFDGGADIYAAYIKLRGLPVIQTRLPRYLDGGRYLQLKSNIDTDSTVKLDRGTTYPSTLVITPGAYPLAGALPPLVPTIPLLIKPIGSGVFSFNIEIPVVMLTDQGADNAGPRAEIWKIRTGLGSEFYSIDDGASSGGCVLMGIGVKSLDWIEIDWEWLP
jgi:hypothetical protein